MPSIFSRIAADKVFVSSLVDKLVVNFPPVVLKGEGKSVSVNRATRLLERAFEAAAQYQSEHAMGMIRRAIFANNFRWALVAAGYSEDFVKVATEGLVVSIMKQRKD